MTERAMPLNLEVGKTYRNREGDAVTISYRRFHSRYPFIGDDHCTYREDGGFSGEGDEPHPFDLVEMTAVEAAHG